MSSHLEGVPDRKIPTLDEWLGDTPRGEGFEEWVKETLWMERAVGDDDKRESYVRISRTMAIAIIETLRIERETYGSDDIMALLMSARAFAIMLTVSLLSRLEADKKPPLRKIGGLIAEEFRHGTEHTIKLTIEAQKSRTREAQTK